MDLLICGLDPGTTSGYALLDLEGNVLVVKSRKNFGLDKLIKEIIEYGRVLVVGCDVKKVPKFVEKFSAELRCSVVYPDEDLSLEEKREIVREFGVRNRHERDALVSAFIGYNAVRKVVTRINKVLGEENKMHYKDKVCELVLKKKINGIKNAVKFLDSCESD